MHDVGMPKRRLDRLSLAVSVSVLGAALVAACSPEAENGGGLDTAGSAGGSSESGRGGSGTENGSGGSNGILSVSVGEGVGGNTNPGGELVINPGDPTLDVEYGTAGQTIQFTAMRSGEEVGGATWFLSSPEAGTISDDGLFTSNGLAGGDITVGARLDDDTATTNLKIHLTIIENSGNISPTDVDTLSNPAPGQADPVWATWYPYDHTVFPRGVPAPAWQFATSSLAGTAYALKVTGANVAYEGYFVPTFGQNNGHQIRPSQPAWEAIGSASDGGDMTVEISKLVGGTKYGPIASTMKIARGKLKGTIYYNTYSSPLAGDAAIMRIRGDLTTPEVLIGDCRVCHSVSADGSTVANSYEQPQLGVGGIFDIAANPDNPPNVWQSPGEEAAFAGLYPFGGTVWVQQGRPTENWQGNEGNTPGSEGQAASVLRTRTGEIIPNSGIEPYYAQTPAFSHDGTMLAFYDRPMGGGTGVLAVMDFNVATNQFTNYRVIATPPPGRHYAWPAFTPDGKVVMYQDGNAGDLATWNGNQARLEAVSLETGAAISLDNLNGDAFVPQGVRDQNVNYEPTMLPLASGGYYWSMVTSRRTFGNTLLGGQGETKRLWVSAIDIDGDGGDISHPPFYVEGQEQAGNSRGFWALDPCRQDGEGCESGDQCCNGFCNPSDENPSIFECGQPDPGSCSDEFESCETAADCCDPAMECINGRCGLDDPNPPN
jgi:hypothetical protein